MTGSIFNHLDEAVARIRPAGMFLAVIIANALLIVLIVVAFVFASSNGRFSVEAATEFVRIDLPADRSAFAWGDVPVDPSSVDALPEACANPTLDLNRPLDGPITVIARLRPVNQRLSISLEGGKNADLGAVTCENGSHAKAGRFVSLLWERVPERNLTLRFLGHVTIGDTPPEGEASPLVLRSGTITTEAVSWPVGGSSVRREVKLYPGDSVKIFTNEPVGSRNPRKKEALAHGILQVTPQGPILLVAHADAREARVIRVGQDREAPNSIAPTLWDRVQAQREWALIILAGAFFLNVFNALRSYRQELAEAGAKPADS